MSGDKAMAAPAGRNVLFVGGPDAGDIRRVPDHVEQMRSIGDFIYRVWPVRMPGDKRVMFFAFDASKHPLEMYREMWREYSVAAHLKRKVDIPAYQGMVTP